LGFIIILTLFFSILNIIAITILCNSCKCNKKKLKIVRKSQGLTKIRLEGGGSKKDAKNKLKLKPGADVCKNKINTESLHFFLLIFLLVRLCYLSFFFLNFQFNFILIFYYYCTILSFKWFDKIVYYSDFLFLDIFSFVVFSFAFT